jgi:hypothetical protein
MPYARVRLTGVSLTQLKLSPETLFGRMYFDWNGNSKPLGRRDLRALE